MSTSDPVVNTKQGKIRGQVLKNDNGVQYYSFKGIPFAKPPVDELRFAVPQPPEPWNGVRDGTKDCNFCAQFDKKSGTVVGDEDCLYLNVYTPKLPKKNSLPLPVMVYFHGGGFVFGDGTVSTNHGPEFLIEKDVVLVIPNYRLGILGFLSLDRKEAPGNMGLRDQVEALKWVQKNIANFGGDANNVTIFGISAGGASVEYQLLSPMAKGLFHKAIAQSGSSLIHWAINRNVKDLASKIPSIKGKSMKNDEELLNYLKEMPIKELITSSMAAIKANEFKGGIHFGFVPTIEKATDDWEPFLSKSTYNLLQSGEFTKVPYMTGVCTREGLLMVSHCAPVLEKFTKEKKFTDYFPFELDDVEKTELEARLKQTYLEKNNSFSDADAFAIDFFGDADFFGGVYTAAKLISKHNSPVYFYEFAHDGALNYVKRKEGTVREGACHGDDGGYLLKNDALTDELSETDEYVQSVIVELWANFAKHGDPNPKTNDLIKTKWEPISETGITCFVISDKPHTKHEIFPERAKLYEEFYEKKFGEK